MNNQSKGEILGHPKGLYILFFAEMWERFSFYGMKALLILYMVNYLFWHQSDASMVFAWYTGLVYATPILGGMVADKWLGARWSVVIGGVIIAIGHFLLAFEPLPFFYSGLGCLVIGTGFLKPNISTQVGSLYRSADERRDSAFTIFYMGINTGAFIGPLVCAWLQLNYGWHYGFAAAGVGMVLGLIVYIMGMETVVIRERAIAAEESNAKQADAKRGSDGTVESADAQTRRIYRDRSIVLVIICVFAILFWVGFEQAANVMNLWADQHTNLHVFRSSSPEVVLPSEPQPATEEGLAGWSIGAAMTQSINPFFIIVFAAVFAWLWQFLQKRKLQPSTPMKMGIAMVFLAAAYGVMLLAASSENRHSSAPLAEVPADVDLTEYGATRLRWEDGTLHMNGVLTDIDWMRALGDSSPASYKQAVGELRAKADESAENIRQAQQAGQADADETWEVVVNIPADLGELHPIAAWPEHTLDGSKVPMIRFDPATRNLSLSATLSGRAEAQLLAAGAEPKFRDALTSIYKQSSTARVSIGWLMAFYLVLTIGELCLSPVGLSLVTKAAPPKYVGLFMGLWFFCTGFIANFVAHTVGGYWGTMTPTNYFMIFGVVGLIAAVIMLLMLRLIKPLLHGIH